MGDALTYTLLAGLPELGEVNNRKISSLVGVASINRNRERLHGKRKIQGGCAAMRTVLYRETLSATQCNPVIKDFYKKFSCTG